MKTFLDWLKELLTPTVHTHCRVCKAPIENGGVGLMYVGAGFCRRCAAEIMRKQSC